jgi:hypothetical protein
MQHLKHKVGLHATRYVPGERRSVVAFVAGALKRCSAK